MKFGIREVTDIVFKTKGASQSVGASIYTNAGTPVFIVDSAKMSSVENAVSTVYAQGGRGNPRLLAWDGDRTATFKFEESIISLDGLAIITGSGVGSGTTSYFRQQYTFTATGASQTITPPLPIGAAIAANASYGSSFALIKLDSTGDIVSVTTNGISSSAGVSAINLTGLTGSSTYVLDFYVSAPGKQLQVEAGKFAGYYYIEANTLFRDLNGADHPAQISIPKAKIKSNFTLTMSPTGDPSTFSFEVDALPDYTYSVTDKKVLYTLDVADISVVGDELV